MGYLTAAGVLVTASLLAQVSWAAPFRTSEGLLEGVRQKDVVVYKGVPFAAPPVGPLRWRPPAPVKPWAGVRKARSFAPGCTQPQRPPPAEQGPSSEDCLYLNAWRPAEAKGKLPVMVWFYGGGFAFGSASWDLFDGTALARHGVIVITFNYRLGALGFLAHPELTAESPHHASGNYGEMDAIAALRWIHSNVAAMGGDPSRVTLFGQSAGALMISDLQASPEARGLFSGVIGESGGRFSPATSPMDGAMTLTEAEAQGAAYAKSLGAPTLAALRALPAERFSPAPPWARPILDGWILPQEPAKVFAAGRQADVPTLVGFNAQEANFPTLLPPVTAASLRTNWTGLEPFTTRLFAAYPFATDDEATQARLQFRTDLGPHWEAWSWARMQSAIGKAPVYYYRFEQPEPLRDADLRRRTGAPHGSEVYFVFQNDRDPRFEWAPADRTLAEQMADYWTNFAKHDDPNGPGLPPWPRYRPGSGAMMRLKATPEAAEEPHPQRLELIGEMVSTLH